MMSPTHDAPLRYDHVANQHCFGAVMGLALALDILLAAPQGDLSVRHAVSLSMCRCDDSLFQHGWAHRLPPGVPGLTQSRARAAGDVATDALRGEWLWHSHYEFRHLARGRTAESNSIPVWVRR